MAEKNNNAGDADQNARPSSKIATGTAGSRTATAQAMPTGKVSAASATGGSSVAKQKRSEDELRTRNPITFIGQVVSELRKVIWPTARQMVVYTIVVLLFLAFMVALVWGVDTLTGLGIRQIFSN